MNNRLLKILHFLPWLLLFIGVIILLSFSIRVLHLKSLVKDQNMADYWGKNFRQVSVYARGKDGEYIDPNQSLYTEDVSVIREYLQNIYDQQSVEYKGRGLKEDGTPNGWEDSYSAFTCGKVEDADVDIFGVGGNFRVFRDFEYLSGAFLPENEENPNMAVINERLSWKLYKSSDVAGNEIKINGKTFVIVGVVRDDEDTGLEKYTDGDNNRIYLYFDMYSQVMQIKNPAILSYEAFLPEFTRGVAVTDIKNALPTYNEINKNYYVTSNTGRFSLTKLMDSNFPIGQKDHMVSSYKLPYWEQLSLLVEKRLLVDGICISSGIAFIIISAGLIIIQIKRKKGETDYSEE